MFFAEQRNTAGNFMEQLCSYMGLHKGAGTNIFYIIICYPSEEGDSVLFFFVWFFCQSKTKHFQVKTTEKQKQQILTVEMLEIYIFA